MGELIYCKRPLAAAPFYIEEVSLNVYSLEELSYYIAQNVYLLNQDFMSKELCGWIGRELGERELMKELTELLREDMPLHAFVGKILQTAGYLTAQEIRDVLEIITTFENKSEAECKKMRADRLLEKEKYVEAIYEYEAVLLLEEEIPMSATLKGDIRHNLATAYGRLFFFEEAAELYEKAYLYNHRVPSLAAMLNAYLLMKDEEGFQQKAEGYHLPKEQIVHIRENADVAGSSGESGSFKTTLSDSMDEKTRLKQCRRQIAAWKENYSRISEI